MEKTNNVIMISGADTVLGRITALRFAEAGKTLALAGRDAGAVQALATELSSRASSVAVLDRRNSVEVEGFVDAILESYDFIDVLINIASPPERSQFVETTAATWQEVIEDQVKGTFNFIKYVSKAMTSQKYGRIVSTASRDLLGRDGLAHYSAATAAIVALTRTCAIELGKFQVTVNAVAPGEIDWGSSVSSTNSSWSGSGPLRRLGRPEEVVNAILFLASEQASFITGQTLYVSGGQELMPALVLEPQVVAPVPSPSVAQ